MSRYVGDAARGRKAAGSPPPGVPGGSAICPMSEAAVSRAETAASRVPTAASLVVLILGKRRAGWLVLGLVGSSRALLGLSFS